MQKMKMYSPIGTQDFMWFMEYEDGSFVTEFNDDGQKVNFYTVSKEDLVNYGITGIGIKLYTNLPSKTFNILGKTVSIKFEHGGKDLIKDGESKFITKPYKHAVNTTVMSTNSKLQQFYDMNSNIAEYEFGNIVEGENATFQLTCHLVKDKHLFIKVKAKSDSEDLNGDLVFTVNGVEQTRIPSTISSEGWQELNWIFEG